MQLGIESDPILHNTTRHIKHFTIFRNHKPRAPFMDGTSVNRVELDRMLQNAAWVRFCIDG